MLIHLSRLVEVEVAEPKAGESQYEPALKLQDGGVDPVRFPPRGEAQDPPGDDEVDNPDDVPQVKERNLPPPPPPPYRPPDEPPRELPHLHVGHIRPKDSSAHDLAPAGQRPYVLRDDRYLG